MCKGLIAGIELIVYDFDGVMTDNFVLLDEQGNESVRVNRSDGYAVSKIRELGITQIIVSTEENSVVERRAYKLKIPVIHNVSDKKKIVEEYCKDKRIDLRKVLYVGNDLNDFSVMQIVGVRCAPKDAEPEILELADWVSCKRGGNGVIRDLLRYITDGR